ncbi:Tet(A)/Tet(B)/Tet(C) family tetracycline efflux MFS transporter [Aquisphaera insulae]|uniref:Tet(A)/Tet(B)/Tet(C) family tetracycline efflux MFS transporter n=1 Tax=Aquisphaera insulae TaxID=2712864 RepID=UPI00196A750F|nr:Tet(A)/Tet(B)/Tet(C) family tetracycline efflux MFS transporter [Aquisphaera insulae]
MIHRALIVILATVALDAVGIGLAMPVIPTLLRDLSHETRIAGRFGYFMAIYPLMQFLFSSVLGRLSDRYGRRPVLLVSLGVASVDYLIMGLSPALGILYVGRVLAGMTGANLAVATAYIADISGPDERARRFGFMNACFGLGFVAGPLLGGLAGSFSPRYPFLLAAGFSGLNLLMGIFVLPESHRPGAASDREGRSFVGSLLSIRGNRTLLPLLLIYFLINLIGQIPGSLWIINGEDRFGWDIRMVGLTFAAFGILHAVAQAFFTEPTTRRFGERGAILLGVACDCAAFIAMALITKGWMVFAIMFLFTAGGIALPAFQALLSRQVSEEHQGELQGTLVSLTSLTEVIGPIAATSLYAASPPSSPGLVWLVGAGLYVLCVPVILRQMAASRGPSIEAVEAAP